MPGDDGCTFLKAFDRMIYSKIPLRFGWTLPLRLNSNLLFLSNGRQRSTEYENNNKKGVSSTERKNNHAQEQNVRNIKT